jgi:hypothetical protein
MTKILLNFYFTSYLLLDAGLDDFGFVEAFEGEDILWFTFSANHVDASELSLSKGTADLKCVEIPLLSGSCSEWGVEG